jgi:hypothetical protein
MKNPPRPQALPTCEHGIVAGKPCRKCREEDNEISKKVRPLVDEYWINQGARDLGHLMLRAYKMGMEHQQKEA